jgi:hypothetical protein
MVIGYCGKVPRNTGIDPDTIAQTEADHLGNCPVCGTLVDMCDLGQVLAHVLKLIMVVGANMLVLEHAGRRIAQAFRVDRPCKYTSLSPNF